MSGFVKTLIHTSPQYHISIANPNNSILIIPPTNIVRIRLMNSIHFSIGSNFIEGISFVHSSNCSLFIFIAFLRGVIWTMIIPIRSTGISFNFNNMI